MREGVPPTTSESLTGRPSKVTRALASGQPALSPDHVMTTTGWAPASPCRGDTLKPRTAELSRSHGPLSASAVTVGVAVGDGVGLVVGVALGDGVGVGFGVVLVGEGDGRGEAAGRGGCATTLKVVDVRLLA